MASDNLATKNAMPVSEPSYYENPEPGEALTKKDLNKLVFRSLLLQASFNYERMQAGGWLYSILPGLKKVHNNKHDLSESMKSHMEFFNTHPFLVNIIMGIVLAMEEKKQNRNTIRAIRVAMMGPLGGIGDALFWADTAANLCRYRSVTWCRWQSNGSCDLPCLIQRGSFRFEILPYALWL